MGFEVGDLIKVECEHGKLAFISDAHEKFYYEKLKEIRCQGVYHKALF